MAGSIGDLKRARRRCGQTSLLAFANEMDGDAPFYIAILRRPSRHLGTVKGELAVNRLRESITVSPEPQPFRFPAKKIHCAPTTAHL